jgi:hypothetical protein
MMLYEAAQSGEVDSCPKATFGDRTQSHSGLRAKRLELGIGIRP